MQRWPASSVRDNQVDLDYLADRITEAELVDQRYSYSTSAGNPQSSSTTIQQAWLAGGPGQSEQRPPPRQLLASPRDFTGRAEQLAELDQLLPDEAGTGPEAVVISAVDGTAGVGSPSQDCDTPVASARIGQAVSTLGLVNGRSVKRRPLFEAAACVRSTRRRAQVVWAGVLGCVGG